MAAVGLLIIRVFIGISMIAHGYPKLTSTERWEWLGSQMIHIGINFGYEIFGFLAGFVETIGGLFFLAGLFFRPSCIALVFTMFIAMMYHVNQGDPYSATSHSLELLAVFLGFAFIGPGKYAIKK